MSALSIQVPFPVFNDRDGQPLDNGYVWIGVPNLPPQTNPVNVYFDDALTILAPQPLRTINGYVSRAGTPAQLYVDGVNFSILVQDSKGSMVYNFPEGTGIDAVIDACSVDYDPPFAGSVQTTVCAKLAETISVKDFGVSPTASAAENGPRLQAALNAAAGNTLYIDDVYQTTPLEIQYSVNIFSPGGAALLSNGDYCLSVIAPIDFLTISGIRFDFPHATETGGTASTSSGRDAITNIPTSPGSTAFANPADAVSAGRVVIENCDFGFGRVTLAGFDTWVEIRKNKWFSDSIVTRPTYVYISETRGSTLENNDFDVPVSNVNEIVKISGLATEARLLYNVFRNSNMQINGGVDIYTGGDKCQMVGNYFYNTSVDRKQTGADGPIVSNYSFDKYIGNHFEYEASFVGTSGLSGGLSIRGSRFLIANNTFALKSNSRPYYAIDLDSEIAPYDDFNTVAPKMWIIQGNMADYSAISAPPSGEHRFISANADADGPVGVCANNLCYGGGRFISAAFGGNLTFVGNLWYDASGSGLVINGASQAGNFIDGSASLRGIDQSVATQGAGTAGNQSTVASEISVIDRSYILLSGTGTVDDFIDSFPGQEINIIQDAGGPTTIANDNNKIRLSGGVNYVMTAQDSLTLVRSYRGWWVEMARSEK